MDSIRSSLSFKRGIKTSLSLKKDSRPSFSLRRDYQILDPNQDNTGGSANLEMSSVLPPGSRCCSVRNTDSIRPPPTFAAKMNALFRKNFTYQKRNLRANIALVLIPVLLYLVLLSIQKVSDISVDVTQEKCGCQTCIDMKGEAACTYECTSKYFDMMFSPSGISQCPEPIPAKWPAIVQIPKSQFRAKSSSSLGSDDSLNLTEESCRANNRCPVTVLLTGSNRSTAENLGRFLFGNEIFSGASTDLDTFNISSNFILGTETDLPSTYFFDPAWMMLGPPLYIIQQKCNPKFSFPIMIKMDGVELAQEMKCVEGLRLWRNSSLEINNEIFKGYLNGVPDGDIREIISAYDFLNTNNTNFNVNVWYNETYKENGSLLRILRTSNAATNSYLQFFKGSNMKILLEFVKEMPKGETSPTRPNLSSTFCPLFLTWVIELFFPIIVTFLVYEKQMDMRILMKMNGLGNGSYWIVSYVYFLTISLVYMLCIVAFGSLVGLKIFTQNRHSIQFAFYFLSINLQIAFAFLASTLFSNIETARATTSLYVFGSGLLTTALFHNCFQDRSYPRELLRYMDIFPGFSLHRGLFELEEYSKIGWGDINGDDNGLKTVLLMMMVEWPILLLVGYYLDQVLPHGSGIRKQILWFSDCFGKKRKTNVQQWQEYDTLLNMEKPDVSHERAAVERALQESCMNHAIVCDNLRDIHPWQKENLEQYTVLGLSIALPRGECFGLISPNGGGKTSFINMITGIASPVSGTAYVQGFNLTSELDKIYPSIGVCPQKDLHWNKLTAREHLLLFGRLKNLKGNELTKAVEESLVKTGLFDNGIVDKLPACYSSITKRKLSVAISIIGNPQVIYIDEPNRGLDPASSKNLWSILQILKQERTMILTTQSTKEAESLCDRVGILVNGHLKCIGSPKELKERYGRFYVLKITTSTDQENEVERLVLRLSPNANKIDCVSGRQRFHLSKQETRRATIFLAMEQAKKTVTIYAWNLTDATLEDIFLNVAKGA